MVVQTIQISFSSYAADTIRIHTGETGREILFVPDMEISGNYSADFIAIKPDDTFTIAAATITDGKINVVIPEQAGAVAGAGHYILKIYDSGEVCIYSASGGFMVDDHLLTDSMIESIADVYGYQFPQDFALKDEAATLNDNVTATNSTWSSSKISEEIEEAAKINDNVTTTNSTWSSSKISEEIAAAVPPASTYIDDNEVLYDKTWSSEKISYELGQITGLDIYSTNETVVGKWIDNRYVYEKTFYISNPSMGSWGRVNTSLQGLDKIIKLEGVYNYAYSSYPLNYTANNTDRFVCYYDRNGDYITYYIPTFSGGTVIFTIRYIKTT